jgi:NAD(P)-dependent dehydrogenase (short-subunit alcohol dehydrogenase family)
MKPLALITGASRGIGRGIAQQLAVSHQVIGTYRGAKEAADSLAAEIGATMFQCDLSSRADRERLTAALSEYAPLDLLVNNAGMAPRERRDMLEATEESFDELINTNVKGPHFLTQALSRRMAENRSGRIVFVTSISAYTASVNRADYCMSKAALSMSAALFAARLAASGVKVFEVRPGIIRTDMIEKVRESYEQRAVDLLPQQRLGDPEDIARAILSIAAGHLDYATGQVLNVDGGFHLRTL